ncbi:MAG: ribonuclease R [Planctomycetaceae bacterium]|nr:ribonuclease R [Planctomycetaceae bacterium]
MVETLKKRILDHLKHRDYTPVKASELAKRLGLKTDQMDTFNQAVEQLKADGFAVMGTKNVMSLPGPGAKVSGIFRGTSKGFGFVTPTEANSHGDLFIPEKYTNNAMSGDIVIATAAKDGHRDGLDRYSGKIIEIVQRANNKFVGTIIKKKESYFLVPDGKFTELVEIDDVTAKNGTVNDKAVVEIISFQTKEKFARGVLIEVLGKSGIYKTEINAVIKRFGIPCEFKAECLDEAGQVARSFESAEFPNRLDLTKKVIVTIDPPDAKDFDDAISIEKNRNGTFTLGVHIADVSEFVKQGSELDTEATKRGNSVYLPGRVIPMLPETLSNGVCSLQPQQRRLAKSAFVTYDDSGKIIKEEFADSVILSKARLTYIEVDKILKGTKTDKPQEVVALLRDMDKLAKIIEVRRRREGMLHLNMPETELVFDDAGKVVDAHPADTSYPHTIIEMFMVEANEAVARMLDRADVPFMRRIHPDPDSLSLKKMVDTLKTFGISAPKNPNRFDLQDIIDKVKGKPMEYAVNTYVLRSLARAEYSPLNIGHFALASKHYCHFTSPIRRYADLLVHRLFEKYVNKESFKNAPTNEELIETGKRLSFTEGRASDAEEDLKAVLILELLQHRLGETMETVICGLANFGIFVQCTKFGIEGLIPMSMLGKDNYVYDFKAQCVHGQRNGKTYHIGQPLTARIVSVNMSARQLNVVPVEKEKEGKEENKKWKKKKQEQKSQRKEKKKGRQRRRR